jgi:hypothetical protein
LTSPTSVGAPRLPCSPAAGCTSGSARCSTASGLAVVAGRLQVVLDAPLVDAGVWTTRAAPRRSLRSQAAGMEASRAPGLAQTTKHLAAAPRWARATTGTRRGLAPRSRLAKITIIRRRRLTWIEAMVDAVGQNRCHWADGGCG